MNLWSPTLLPYLIPLTLVVVFVALQVFLVLVAGIDLGLEVDHDVDLDADVDIDAHVPIGIGHGLDLDVDHDVDLDHEVGGHHEGFSLARLLSPLGVGQVPLSIIGEAWGLAWGVSGLALTYALSTFVGTTHTWFLAITLPLTTLCSWHATKRLVRFVAPMLRISGRAESFGDLVGRTGRVTSLRVDEEYGEVCLQVNGAPSYVYVISQGEKIERDSDVVVIEYDVARHRPVVAPLDDGVASEAPVTTSKGA